MPLTKVYAIVPYITSATGHKPPTTGLGAELGSITAVEAAEFRSNTNDAEFFNATIRLAKRQFCTQDFLEKIQSELKTVRTAKNIEDCRKIMRAHSFYKCFDGFLIFELDVNEEQLRRLRDRDCTKDTFAENNLYLEPAVLAGSNILRIHNGENYARRWHVLPPKRDFSIQYGLSGCGADASNSSNSTREQLALLAYKDERANKSSSEYLGVFSFFAVKLGYAHSKTEKFEAVDALIECMGDPDLRLNPQHLPPLNQGELGKLVEHLNIDLNQYIYAASPYAKVTR